RRAAGSSVSPDSESRRRRNHGPPKSGIPNRKKTRMHTRLSCAKSITCSGQIITIDQSLPNSSRTTIKCGTVRLAWRAIRHEASAACRRRRSVYRTLNLPRGSREVLGLDLNCSESTGTGPSFPYLQKARSPHDEGRPVKVEGQTAEVRRWGVRLSLRFLTVPEAAMGALGDSPSGRTAQILLIDGP